MRTLSNSRSVVLVFLVVGSGSQHTARYPAGRRPSNIKKEVVLNELGKPEIYVYVMDDVAGVSRVKAYKDTGLSHQQQKHNGVNAEKGGQSELLR